LIFSNSTANPGINPVIQTVQIMTDSPHVVCPHCNAINRIPATRLADGPSCGNCHEPLYSAKPLDLTSSNFQKHIERNDVPVVVDFWAPWCAPCKTMAPAFEKAAAQLEPAVRLAKLNTENEQQIAAQFRIQSIPTMALFRNGREIARQAGAMSAADIVRWVQSQV
jgi:thioredoxin 2